MMLFEYLLKSAACMGAFLLFYQFLLEKENMHVFKRYFLLLSIVASLIIPTLVFTEYVEASPAAPVIQSTIETGRQMNIANKKALTDMDVVNWSLLFWSIYFLGVIGFGFRFFKHLFQIGSRIRRNPKLKRNLFTQVLLSEKMPPHTFFKYIFLNKVAVEKKSIPEEVILHEETHAKQLHSIDVLFIELLQVLLWFNPLIYLFKRNIKLNHEFLADSAVLKENVPTKSYQNTLLSYLSKESNQKYQSVKMANAINYSSIKKRFIIMKTETSRKSKFLKSILPLPLAAILLVGFSQKQTITVNPNDIKEYSIKSVIINIKGKNRISLNNIVTSYDMLMTKVNELNSFLTSEEKQKYVWAEIQIESDESLPLAKAITEDLFKIDIYNSSIINIGKLKELGIKPNEVNPYKNKSVEEAKIIYHRNKELQKTQSVNSENEPWSIDLKASEVEIIKASRDELKIFNELAKKYNSVPIKKRAIPTKDLNVLETIYRKMTQTQKEKAQPFPECLPKNQQEGATREQMRTYNALARKYNEMDRDNMRISMKDVEQLKYIYGLMSDKQKADAEPFPDFPEPPPPPESPRVLKGEASDIPPPPLYVKTENTIISTIPPAKSPKVLKGEVSDIPPPPAPPTPPDPLDHVIDMAKKGAAFYYEGKKISSDRAIELLKKNKSLNIQTTKHGTDNPQVKISKEPITFKH